MRISATASSLAGCGEEKIPRGYAVEHDQQHIDDREPPCGDAV
jgi:hypothetical protein